MIILKDVQVVFGVMNKNNGRTYPSPWDPQEKKYLRRKSRIRKITSLFPSYQQ